MTQLECLAAYEADLRKFKTCQDRRDPWSWNPKVGSLEHGEPDPKDYGCATEQALFMAARVRARVMGDGKT